MIFYLQISNTPVIIYIINRSEKNISDNCCHVRNRGHSYRTQETDYYKENHQNNSFVYLHCILQLTQSFEELIYLLIEEGSH